jgi:integrase/recombinase XerD
VLAEYELNRALKEIRGLKRNTRAVDASKTLSGEEIRILLRSKTTSERVKLFIEFLLTTGARISEATGIRLTDIRPEPGFSLVRLIGKGSKERTLKVRRELILRILKAFSGMMYLFETKAGNRYDSDYASAQIRLAGRTLLGRTISAHTMRHTFATNQIRKNRKVKALSTYLGHSSTSITQDMYVHEELDLEDLDLDI